MTFFTVEEIEIPVYDTYADGEYTMEIVDMQKKSSFYDGIYIEIHRQFMDSEYENKVWPSKYLIHHDNPKIKHAARQIISRLAINIANIKPGEDLEPEHIIGKITKILVRNDVSTRGNKFSKIIREELVTNDESRETAQDIANNPTINGIAGSGMQPINTTLPSDALNDEVPFL